MTLREILPGQNAVVEKLGGEGPLRRRMIDMGVTPGTIIHVISVAPMGDPVKIFLRGYELSLRKDDAERITIDAQSVSGNPIKSSFGKAKKVKL